MPKKLLLLSLCSIHLLYAQQNEYKLDQVVSVATKSQNSLSELAAQVEVISNEEIKNNGYLSTAEILANTPSIQSAPDGSSISLRGMAHNDTLILIDGRRVVGEFEKKYELERIPAGMIERIEILKGSGSVLYGSDAMGGVINIITKKPTQELLGEVNLLVGDDKEGFDLFIAGAKGDTTYKLYANTLRRGAYSKNNTADTQVMQGGVAKTPSTLQTPNAPFTNLKNTLADSYTQERDYTANLELLQIGLGLTHRFNEYFEAGIDASYLDEKKDGLYLSDTYPTAYTLNNKTIMARNIFAHEYNENIRKSFGVFATLTPREDLSISYDLAHTIYEKDRSIYTPLFSDLGYSSYSASQNGVNISELTKTIHNLLSTYIPNEKHKILFGGEIRDSKNSSSALNTERENYALFAQHEYKPLQTLKLIYGGRYDKDSIGDDQISLSIGANYSFTKNTKLRANYAQGFKSPDDRDLYVNQTTPNGRMMYGSTVVAGDKLTSYELKPETSQSYDLGVIYNANQYKVDLGIYQTDVEDKIERQVFSTYQTFQNITEVRIQGFEASLSAYLGESFMTKLYYTSIDARDRSDDSRLLYTPKEAASVTLSYFLTEDLEFKTTTKYTGEQRGEETKLGGYTLTNIKLLANNSFFKGFDLYCGIDNLFAKELSDEIGRIAEHYYYVGAKYSF